MTEKAPGKFTELYKGLNPAQKKAVDSIDGPVMVIAGPGTGKTTILTFRIASILKKTDTPPDAILALTFTESGARSMRQKLIDIVGQEGYRVRIHTFHSFCNDIIKSYPSEFPRIIGAEHATDADILRILEDAVLDLPLKILRPWGEPLHYVAAIRNAVKDLKREAVAVLDFEKQAQAERKKFEALSGRYHVKGAHKGKMKGEYKERLRNIEKNEELLLVYGAYEEALRQERLFDYEDMIMEVVRTLEKNESLALELQESAQYILADEHQDANNAQNKLLEIMSSFFDRPNLFIVGDEKQAIFRFQGASLDNFLYFKKRFPAASVISLRENYRSPQKILDAAGSLIEKNKTEEYLKVKLKGAARRGGIKLAELSRPETESMYVAHEASLLLKKGVKPSNIAVLYRDNADAEKFERAFKALTIPTVTYSDTDLLSEEEIEKCVTVLRAANEPSRENMVKALLLDYFNLPHHVVYEAIHDAREARTSLASWIESSAQAGKELKQALAAISDISKTGRNKNLLAAVEYGAEKLGLVAKALKDPNGKNILRAYDRFLSFIMRFQERHKGAKLADFFKELERMETHNQKIDFQRHGDDEALALMTAHRSKGLEFDYVFVTGVYEGKWSGRKRRDKLDPFWGEAEKKHNLEDDRRLFYVALTRAREEATVSYPKEDSNGKEALPSELIGEIDPDLIEKIDIGEFENKTYPKMLGARGVESTTAPLLDKRYLNKLFLEQGLSVSALNGYLECPWRYFFVNLLRVPKSEEKHLIFGTAIHEGLKTYFNDLKNGKEDDRRAVLVFESVIKKSYLEDREIPEVLQKGGAVLLGFLKRYKGTWEKEALIEFSMRGVSSDIGGGAALPLSGKLDRVEFEKDGGAVVYDFKTGKARSRNEIEGKTKNSDGNLKRQLVFYRLLLDKFENGKYKMKKGVLDFVEPTDSGLYKREEFEITADDVFKLEEEIRRVGREILDLSFWNKKCDDKACEWCSLRKLIA